MYKKKQRNFDKKKSHNCDFVLQRSRFRHSTHSSQFKPNYMHFRSSLPSMTCQEEPPKIYPLEQLMITNYQLPPDVDRNFLEVIFVLKTLEVMPVQNINAISLCSIPHFDHRRVRKVSQTFGLANCKNCQTLVVPI